MDDLDHDSNRSRTYSTRQRTLLLTFDSVEDAEEWDEMDNGEALLWLTQLVWLNKELAGGGPRLRAVNVDRPDRTAP